VTERKPPEVTFATWVDQQINEAAARGAFDNLPGAGKPIAHHDQDDDGQAWIRDKLRREGVSTEALLPPPLRLRRDAERLAEAVPGLRSEQQVRDAVAELNRRITEWRRIPVGPPVFVALADEQAMLDLWRAARPPGPHPEPAPPPSPSDRPPWWRRLRR
jgi:hypothetical protein